MLSERALGALPRFAFSSRTTKTGQGACWTRRSAVLPRSARFRPVRPWVDVTMRSAEIFCACQQIMSKGALPISAALLPRTPYSAPRSRKRFAAAARASSKSKAGEIGMGAPGPQSAGENPYSWT